MASGQIIRNDVSILGNLVTVGTHTLGDSTMAGSDRTIEVSGSGLDIDLKLITIGTGTIKTRVDYDDDIADNEDLINLKYLKEHITNKPASSLLQAPTATENLYAITWDYTAGNFTLTDLGIADNYQNGITKTGANVELGGPLVQNTEITGAFALSLGTDASKLTTFDVHTSGNIDIRGIGNSQLLLNGTHSISMIGGSVSSVFILNNDGAPIIQDNRAGANQRGLQGQADYSANVTANDYIQKVYADSHIVSRTISATLANPTVTEHLYVIAWDNTNTRFNLVAQTGGGGGGHNIENSSVAIPTQPDLNFTNGLTAVDDAGNTASVVKLGGNISENTTISIDATFTFQIGGNNGALTINDSTLTTDITVGDNAFFTIGGGVNFQGAKYSADYSAAFVSRSLIDKGYADATYAPISGGAYWSLASGGTLTGANTITGTGTNTLKFVFNSLSVTPVNGAGHWLANTTAAALGAQQISPSTVWEGNVWETTGGTSQSVKWRADVLPVQGATGSSTFRLMHSLNAGAYADGFTATSLGNYSFKNVSGSETFTINAGSGAYIGTTSSHSFSVRSQNVTVLFLDPTYTTIYKPTIIAAAGGTPTASTQFDIRGLGTTTNLSLRVADSSNAVTLEHTDAGQFTIYSNTSSSLFVRLTGSGTSQITFSNSFGTGAIGIHSGAANRLWTSLGLNVAGSTNSIAFTNSTGTDTSAPRIGRLAGTSGTGGLYYSAEVATLNANRTLHQFSGGLTANGTTLTLTGLYIPMSFNDGGFSGHTVYGIDYSPTITGAGLTHIAFRSTSGNWQMQGSATTLTLGGGATASELRFLEPSGGGTSYTAFKAVAQGGNITYSLPPALGAANSVLTDVAGDGVLTWVVPSGSGDMVLASAQTSTGKKTFSVTGGIAGINIGANTTDPTTTLAAGDMYYQTGVGVRVYSGSSWSTIGGGGSSAGANNEVQTSDGAGGFVASKLFFDETSGAMSLGDSGLGGTSRTITAVGSGTNIDVSIYTKGTSLFGIGAVGVTDLMIFRQDTVGSGIVGGGNGLLSFTISGRTKATKGTDVYVYSGNGLGSGDDGGDLYLNAGASGGGAGNHGNISLGLTGTVNFQSMERGLFIPDAIAPPTGNPTNGLFKHVDPTEKVMKVRDEDGEIYNETTRDGTIGVTFDSSVSAGEYIHVRVPYSGKFVSWDITTSDGASSSIVVDVRKGTYASTFPLGSGVSIAGTEKPTLSSAAKNQDTSLSTWTTAFSEDDYIAFYIDSVSGLTGKVHVTLKVLKNS